jgi:hypothetical protein
MVVPPTRRALDDRTLADALRVLAIDVVEEAKSGHPGAPMGLADIAQVLWRTAVERQDGPRVCCCRVGTFRGFRGGIIAHPNVAAQPVRKECLKTCFGRARATLPRFAKACTRVRSRRRSARSATDSVLIGGFAKRTCLGSRRPDANAESGIKDDVFQP